MDGLLKGLPRRPNMLRQVVKGLQQQALCALRDRVERRKGIIYRQERGSNADCQSSATLKSIDGGYRKINSGVS